MSLFTGAGAGGSGCDLTAVKSCTEQVSKVLVVRDAKEEKKDRGLRLGNIISQGSRGGRGQKLRPLSVKLFQSFSGAGSTTVANTTYTTVLSMIPSGSAEFASLADLYDEFICDGGSIHFNSIQIAGGGAPVSASQWVWVFDPLNATALGSIVNGYQHAQHYVFSPPTRFIAVGYSSESQPYSVNRNGIHTFSWRIPAGSARSDSASTIYSGQWADTASTTATYGFLKPYWPATDLTSTHNFSFIVEYHCRFRSRS